MAASMETLGIGGHEYFAEKIFEKVKGLPKDLELVELTKNEYDALTPEQKADPTKLYLVPGDGKYLKFQEISAADYEALSQEAKMDPYTVYMTPGDGTYFRVIDITQEEYDALTPEEKANPNNLYLIPGDDVEYLTKTVADTLYAGINDIPDVSGLLSKTEAASTYQTISGMSSYLTSSTAASTYLSKSDASSTYQTQSGMSSYLTSSSAATTYLSKTDAASTYATVTYVDTEIAKINGVEYIKKNSLPQAPDTGHEKAIYLVPATAETNDLFDEYYWVDNAWELFGTAKLDLSTYETSAHAASTYLTKSQADGYYQEKDFVNHYGEYTQFFYDSQHTTDQMVVIDVASSNRANVIVKQSDRSVTGQKLDSTAYYSPDGILMRTFDTMIEQAEAPKMFEFELAKDKVKLYFYKLQHECQTYYDTYYGSFTFSRDGNDLFRVTNVGDIENLHYSNGWLYHANGTAIPSWITDPTSLMDILYDYLVKLKNMEPQDMTNYYTKTEVASTYLSKTSAASDYVPFETTSDIDIVNTDKNIHHVLSSYHDYAPAFFTYVNRTSSYRNTAALSTDYMEFNTMDSDDSTHYNERVRLDAKDGLLIQYHEDDNGSEGDLHKIELGYDGLKLDGMLVGNTVVVNCHEASEGDTGILVSDKSLFEMMELIDNGYNITLRYIVDDHNSGSGQLVNRNVKMLKLEQYNHVYDISGDPLAHDDISITFSVQPTKGTTWYYEMRSNDGQDTLYLEKDFT